MLGEAGRRKAGMSTIKIPQQVKSNLEKYRSLFVQWQKKRLRRKSSFMLFRLRNIPFSAI
jgi:hypothetical protein